MSFRRRRLTYGCLFISMLVAGLVLSSGAQGGPCSGTLPDSGDPKDIMWECEAVVDATLAPYDAIVDPLIGDTFATVEDPLPQPTCAARTPGTAESEEVFLCTSATSGGGGTGNTYYVGDSSYRCERLAEPYNESGNHRFPRQVYNSQRNCKTQYSYVASGDKRGAHSLGTFRDGEGGKDLLVSIEFSKRTVESFCGGRPGPERDRNPADNNVSRCLYRYVKG